MPQAETTLDNAVSSVEDVKDLMKQVNEALK